MLRSQIFCLVKQKLNQWILKFNMIRRQSLIKINQPSIFIIQSAKARVSQAPATIWHDRLAHCGSEVLQHLPTSVTGVKLVDGLTTTECETCAISKAHAIISRRQPPQAEDPFDWVHWDMIYFHEGFNGDLYASHFLDEKTRMNWVYPYLEKTQVALLKIFENFTTYIER